MEETHLSTAAWSLSSELPISTYHFCTWKQLMIPLSCKIELHVPSLSQKTFLHLAPRDINVAS